MNKNKLTYDKKFLQTQRDRLKFKTNGLGEHYRVIGDSDGTGSNNLVCMDNVSCFGGFHYLKSNGQAGINFNAQVLIVNHPNAADTESIRAFIDWCVNASPYSDVFIDKDVDFIYKNPIAINCHFHARMVIGAGILIRYREQMVGRVNTWYNFVKRGVHPDLAFILCHYVDSVHKDGFVSSTDAGAHGLWENRFSTIRASKNFLSHDYPGAPSDPRTVNAGYYSYSGLWEAWNFGNDSKNFLSLPKSTETISVDTGWSGRKAVVNAYLWKNLDKFIDSFLDINNLQDEYAIAIKRDKKRKRAA